MSRKYAPINYHEYLGLDQILSSQKLMSEKYKKPAHDEMLFIIIHQAYELWFKQILHELDSILNIFTETSVSERSMGLIVSRLNRVTEIQKLLLEQVRILETMTPLDFLDFRDMLIPASGFQSFQFRLLENKLGLKTENRLKYNKLPYQAHLTEQQQQQIHEMETQPSLFDCVDKWLARTPFLNMEGFDFWASYRDAVNAMFERDKDTIKNNASLSKEDMARNLELIEKAKEVFTSLFDQQEYQKQVEQGQWRLSYKALQAALLIQLYRDQPVLQLPFRLITALLDIDELLTNWRYRHALMVKRMLGTKIGTGGSSGYEYLRDATERHKIFSDFFQLTTFFIPRSELPEIPQDFQRQFGFFYNPEA